MSVTRDAYGRVVARVEPVYEYPTACQHCSGTQLFSLINSLGSPQLCNGCAGVTPTKLVEYREVQVDPTRGGQSGRLLGDVDRTDCPQAPVQDTEFHPM